MKSIMDYEKIQQERKDAVLKAVNEKIAQGCLPNIKSMENMVRKLKKKIKMITKGATLFAYDLKEVERADSRIAFIKGEIEAYQVYINKYYSDIKIYGDCNI